MVNPNKERRYKVSIKSYVEILAKNKSEAYERAQELGYEIIDKVQYIGELE